MLIKKITAIVITLGMLISCASPLSSLNVSAASSGFELFNAGSVAKIYLDTDATGKTEHKQVVRAGNDLKNDIKAVTSVEPQIVSTKSAVGTKAIIVGTLGKSDLIDELVASGKIDDSEITGQWEAFMMKEVEKPFPGCDSALIIAGSDKRGTIYGIYELSEMIGVSPWYWWGDVPIEKKSSIILPKADIEKTEKPDVKFRGIFINDEKNLTNWSAKFSNSTTSPGTPNPDMYAHVFELMLRLKSNTLWPAMHNYSTAFNAAVNPQTGKPFNAQLADNYGIIMGASHCELLLRNNETEWGPWCDKNVGKYNLIKINNDWHQSYDYTVNPTAMNAYWRERVAVNYKYDNLYTIGLRGVHDSGILCKNLADPTYENKAKVVKQAVEAQIEILKEFEQKYYEETGERKVFDKVYCPYKEAAEYFKYDLSLPPETYLLWADDNYGYVRAIGDQPQLDKYQGAGVYYHISYWGRPNSTLWVASTPLTQIYSEMSKAYNAGSKDVFMLNVGDIKPGEIPIEFFMNLGWDIDEYNENTIGNYLAKIAARDFGFNEQQSIEFANILKEHYQITAAKRPETQGKNMGTEYSITNYGDEAQQTINKMIDVCNRSETLMNSLDAGKKTAYYQMVQYMIRASRYSFEKSYYQQKNQLYYTQGRFASVNAYAKASLDAYSKILSDVTYYNTTLSSGKWNGILNPYVSDIPQPAGSLPLSYVSDISASDGVGYVCEGQINGTESVTMNFNSLTDDQRFIDVFNRGKTQANFKITTDEKIKIITSGNTVLTKTTENNKNVYIGKVNVEDRVWAVVDWSKAADGKQTANITVSDDFGNSKTYTASIVKATVNPETEKSTNNGFYETNGEVSIEAEHYSRNVAVGGQEWRVMPGLGRSGDSMKVFPDLSAATNATRIDSNFETTSPYLEYKVYFESTGNFIPTMYRLPTLNEGKTCRTAIQFDNGTISLFKGNTFATDEDTGAWATGVLNNIEKLTLDNEPFNVTTPGWHTIKVYKSDAGIVIDKLVLRKQSQPEKASHLGAPESFNTIISYNKQSLAKAPTFSLSDLTFPASNQKYYFDFSSDASNVSAGYIGIDNKMQKSALKCYEWDSDGFASLNAAIRTAEKTSVRDQGIVYSAAASGIKFKMPKAGKYLVSLAIGDRLSGGISVSNMNVTVNGSEVIKGLNVTSGRTIEKGFIVDVSEDQTLKLNLSGSWVLAAVEITPYKEATANDGNLSFTPDINGNINIEAEAAMENSEYAQSVVGTDSYQSEWVPSSGISGHGMFAGPNVNNGYSDTNMATNKGAKLKYKVNFKNTGVYNVWVLVKSQCADDDSLLISIDSGTPIVLNDFRDTESNFKWLNAGQLSVSTAGIHTLTVCEREDGLVLDKIVLTRSTVNPINTGGVMTRDKETIDTTQLDAKIQQGMALLDGNYPEDDLVELRLAIQNANYAKSKENVTNAEIASALDRLTKAIDKLNPSVKPTRIEISKRSLYIQVGKTANLTAVISPSNATNKEVQWTSANKSVATVDSNGKVTAKASGTTTIYATTSNGLQASCTIYVKGWYQSAGKWYFNDDNGKATNKWIKDSSKWYYVDAKGVMQTNKWIKSSGKYYYVDSKGVMSTNKWIKSSGKYYYVDKNGIMQANKWIKASGKYYYVDSKGVMSTNKWIKSSGKWYYVDKNGIMFSNTSKKIGGKTYKFNKSGACINP